MRHIFKLFPLHVQHRRHETLRNVLEEIVFNLNVDNVDIGLYCDFLTYYFSGLQ